MYQTKPESAVNLINTFCSNQLFQDFDQWAEAFKTWNLTSTQLSQGKFQGELAIANFGCLQFIYASTNQALQIIGAKPPNAIVFSTLLTCQDTELISHNQRLNQNVLFGLDPTRETNVITQKSCQVGICTVSIDTLKQYMTERQREKFNQAFFRKNIVLITPTKLSNFKSYLQQFFHVLQTNPTWLQAPSSQKLIIGDCLPLLISTLDVDSDLSDAQIPTLKRYQIVKEVEDFMLANISKPLTLNDLCTAVKTSPRALSYGIQDVLAMSPMEYLKVMRLNGVRRSLKASDPERVTVLEIATNWGFWSMSHFSRDYKQLFGELPSQTLKSRV